MPVLSGDDGLTLPILAIGGTGVITVSANIIPKDVSTMIAAFEGGNIDHPKLQKGKRARMKIFPVDPWEDIPVKSIYAVLSLAKRFYK